MLIKRFLAVMSAIAVLLCLPMTVSAESSADLVGEMNAKGIYVCEPLSGAVLYEKDSDKQYPMGHMAKLMTVLITAEEIESEHIKLTDTVTVSANANSKQGTQIWLDVGEKITIEELLKAITIGNANDACTALAEKLSGSEEEYLTRMSKRAERLGMNDTAFADCTGTDKATVSTAHDVALLTAEISKFDFLDEYLTTWIDYVRDDAVELVSTNRMIRTYKGIKGTKSCSPEGTGETLAVCAKRGDFTVCAVILGADSEDNKFSYAKELLDGSFENYRLFSPQIPDEYLKDIAVTGGEKFNVLVEVKDFAPIVLSVSEYSDISYTVEIAEKAEAPVKKGDILGTIQYQSGEKDILKAEIVAAEEVKAVSFGFSLQRYLLNLLKMR